MVFTQSVASVSCGLFKKCEQTGEGILLCPFCGVSRDAGFDVVYEDTKYIAFSDRSPACVHHFQLVPKDHLDSIRCLGKSDVGIVRYMEKIAQCLLDDLGIPQSLRRIGFHIPPFTSVMHLHMHVQALPYKSPIRAAKYRISRGSGTRQKGFSWFVDVRQVIRLLEQDTSIGVFPC